MEEVKVEVFSKRIGESIQKFLQDYDKSAELIEQFVECSHYYSHIKPENIDIIIAYLESRYKGSQIKKLDTTIDITTTGTYSNACKTDQKVSELLNVLGDYGLTTIPKQTYKYYIKTTAKDALRWYLTSNSDNHRLSQIMSNIMSESGLKPLNEKPKTLIEITHAESEKANPLEYYDQFSRKGTKEGGSTRKHKYHHIQNRRKSITNKRRRTTRTRK